MVGGGYYRSFVDSKLRIIKAWIVGSKTFFEITDLKFIMHYNQEIGVILYDNCLTKACSIIMWRNGREENYKEGVKLGI